MAEVLNQNLRPLQILIIVLVLLYFIFSNATAQILGLHVDSVIYVVLLKVTDTLQIRTCDALHNSKLISMHLRAKLKATLNPQVFPILTRNLLRSLNRNTDPS